MFKIFANCIKKIQNQKDKKKNQIALPEFKKKLTNNIIQVVALEEIKGHFPSGTTFEDYWPAKGSIEPVASRLV